MKKCYRIEESEKAWKRRKRRIRCSLFQSGFGKKTEVRTPVSLISSENLLTLRQLFFSVRSGGFQWESCAAHQRTFVCSMWKSEIDTRRRKAEEEKRRKRAEEESGGRRGCYFWPSQTIDQTLVKSKESKKEEGKRKADGGRGWYENQHSEFFVVHHLFAQPARFGARNKHFENIGNFPKWRFRHLVSFLPSAASIRLVRQWRTGCIWNYVCNHSVDSASARWLSSILPIRRWIAMNWELEKQRPKEKERKKKIAKTVSFFRKNQIDFVFRFFFYFSFWLIFQINLVDRTPATDARYRLKEWRKGRSKEIRLVSQSSDWFGWRINRKKKVSTCAIHLIIPDPVDQIVVHISNRHVCFFLSAGPRVLMQSKRQKKAAVKNRKSVQIIRMAVP